MAEPEKRERNGKVRWYARYRDPEGKQRSKTFDRKTDAQAFLDDQYSAMRRGRYIDLDAGKRTLRSYAEEWFEAQGFEPSTRDAVKQRLESHVYKVLGPKALRDIKPTTIQAWLRTLDHLAPNTIGVIYTHVGAILAAAVEDDAIAKNPARARSVRVPTADQVPIVPWTPDQVADVHDALPNRYAVLTWIGAGLGLRQGEVFGLSPEQDIDWLRGVVKVQRQVKVFGGNRLVFALPKGRKVREVPLPSSVRDELAAYLAVFPAHEVALPREEPGGREVTVPLLVTSREGKALNRNYINGSVWKPALQKAKIPDTRENMMHVLRHTYASTLLDAGENIKALAEYLGHADPGFTLRTYTHLMPSSSERTRKAVDAMFAARGAQPGEAVGG